MRFLDISFALLCTASLAAANPINMEDTEAIDIADNIDVIDVPDFDGSDLVDLEARDTLYRCPQGGRISKNNAMGVIHQAPPESKKGQTTGSDYPHEFFNHPDKKTGKRMIPLNKWNKKCLDSKKKQKRLLEAPIFQDKHLYKFQQKKPKENPGPARVIYTADHDKYFCGIIAHTKPNNQGNFAICT